MTELLSVLSGNCGFAECCCDHSPCFRARLEATAGDLQVHATTDLCARHLGSAVQGIAAWARAHELRGQLTILVIDRPTLSHAAGPQRPGDRLPTAFPFSAITLGPGVADCLHLATRGNPERQTPDQYGCAGRDSAPNP